MRLSRHVTLSRIRKIHWLLLHSTDKDFPVQFESAACSNNTFACYCTVYQISVMNPCATIFLLMGFVQTIHTLDGNQLLFTVIGETTRESGYAHLVVPLPIPTVGHTVDVLHDLIKTFGEFTMKPTNLYQKTESYGIDRIQAKIGLILSLAHQGGFVAKELHYDDVNLIMDGLRNLGSKRRRSVAATVGALFGLASFGSSIFHTAQLHRLNEDRQRIEENQQFLMEELVEHNLRIHNITRFVEYQYRGWVKQVKVI